MIATPRLVLDYCRQGYRPIPFEQRSKKSAVSDWVQLRVSEQDVVRYWSDGQGVGLVLGPSGLLDIDIDDDVAARLAPCFLPPTGMIGGHDNRPATHWFYRGSVAAAGTSAAGGRVSAALTPAVGIGDSDCGSGGHAVVAAVAACFLWVCVRRSKHLPDGGQVDMAALQQVIARLEVAVTFARSLQQPLGRDSQAAGLWREVYPALTAERPGQFGAITARAEAQVLRLSLIYAVLDCSAEVRAEHLTAALAVWQYCEDSARWIWGDSTGGELADEILRLLRAWPDGLTRKNLHGRMGRNHSADRLGGALGVLLRMGLVRRQEVADRGGRPAERWVVVPCTHVVGSDRGLR